MKFPAGSGTESKSSDGDAHDGVGDEEDDEKKKKKEELVTDKLVKFVIEEETNVSPSY